MQAFIRKHIEGFLILAAVVLIGVMAFSFIWGLTFASESVNSVFQPPSAAPPAAGFNISGAQHLNLHGLVP